MKLSTYFKSFTLAAALLSATNMNAQTVAADNIVMRPGEGAALSISLSDATRFNAAGMYIVLPEGFSFDTIGKGEAANAGDTLALGMQAATILRFALIDTENNAAFTTDGTLLTATVLCDSTIATGTYTGEVKTIELSAADASAGLTTLPDVAFTITVTNEDPTGISSTEGSDEADAEIYDTTGKRLSATHKGIYIYKYANGNVKKVIIK